MKFFRLSGGHWPYGAVVLVAIFTHFWRLDSVSLWRDEATTACWAREIIQSDDHLPRAWNGNVLVAQGADAHDFNQHYLPAMQSWLQFYVTAISFKLFGISTFSARLPFALIGLLCIYFMFDIGKRIFKSPKIGALAALVTSLSFPYLLFIRECRYYALSMLFCILLLREVLKYIAEPERARSAHFYIRLALWGVLLYFSNYLTFAIMWGCLSVYFLIDFEKRTFRNFVITSVILAAVLSIEFLLLHMEFIRGTSRASDFQLEAYWKGLRRNLIKLNELIPFYALLLPGIFLFFRKIKSDPIFKKQLLFLLITLVFSVIFNVLLTKSQMQVRYYLQVIPVNLLLFLMFWREISVRFGAIIGALFLILVMSWHNLLYFDNLNEAIVQQQFQGKDDYNGALIEFIEENIKPNETVAFYRNVKGMAMYFRFPWLRWVAQLDASSPQAQTHRGKLPDHVFDDTPNVDWYILWDKRKFDMQNVRNYKKVWSHEYVRRDQRRRFWRKKKKRRIFEYEIFRRVVPDSGNTASQNLKKSALD